MILSQEIGTLLQKTGFEALLIYSLLQRNYFYVICKQRWKRRSSRFSG